MEITTWLITNWLELFGTVSALVYLYFSIKQSIWLWPLGILASAVYIIVYFDAKFYADMGLQVYYVAISIYGWYHWKYGKGTTNANLPIVQLNTKLGLILGIISVVLFVALGLILTNFTDSEVPWGDALTTALSIVATYMLAQKILEHWLMWVFIDALSLGLYLYKGLYITAILFVIYTVMAIVGFIEWKKEWKKNQIHAQ